MTIGERALMVLEQVSTPLSYWDIRRLMDRQAEQPTSFNSLLVFFPATYGFAGPARECTGLYRHGLIPNVRGLGPAAEVHLLAAPTPLCQDQLHFVLQHQGYRYQAASLAAALTRHLGYSWRSAITTAESEAGRVRREQRLAELLQMSRRSPHFQQYHQGITDRVQQALTERARRLT